MLYHLTARMYTGLLTIFLLLTLGARVGTCESDCEIPSGPCPGERPRIPNKQGCCPARAGEACGDDVKSYCDTALGYRCLAENGQEGRGTCQGTFRLRGFAVEANQVTLEWLPFAPVNYTMEYSLIYRAKNFSEDRESWTSIECGDETEYVLRSLTPATWYFIRIGVWKLPFDHNNMAYSNITETLMIKTREVEYCEHAGKKYEVGQVFNNNNEDQCTCLSTGKLVCSPLCPHQLDGLCDEAVREGDCVDGECTITQANCSVNGSIFTHGQEFEQGCKACRCDNGVASCILPSECMEMESTEECESPQSYDIEGKCCPEWTCGSPPSQSCLYHDKEYTGGHEWQDEETCGKCQCKNGKVSCYNFCEEPELPENCPRPHRRKSPNGCCEIYECLQPVDMCVFANGTFRIGEFLTGDKCELCVCSENNTVKCSPSCGKVELPLPSIYCPQPQIRIDGCCETLFCRDPDMSIRDVIRSIYASSHGSNSVTLSFKTKKSESGNAEEEYTSDYRIHFADAEEAGIPSKWKKKDLHLKPTVIQADEVVHPAQVLQTTGAILVDGRAYITISGLKANTTYYFKIAAMTPEGEQNDEEVTQQTTTFSPDIVSLLAVKTLAKNLTCSVKDRQLRHGEMYQDECERKCQCDAGEITCKSNCPQLNRVMMPSASCPRPKLETLPGSCCPTWVCAPTENGCHYDNMALADGEQIREGCERVCTCKAGNMTCRPVCNTSTEPPRRGCQRQQIPNNCCKAWMCPPDKRLIRSVESVLETEFNQPCLEPSKDFEHAFIKEMTKSLDKKLCNRLDFLEREICAGMDIVVTCPSDTLRRRREREIKGVLVNFGLSIPRSSDETITRLNSSLEVIVDGLASIFNTSQSEELNVSNVLFTSSGTLSFVSLHYACDSGYTFSKNVCVRTEILNNEPTFSVELSPISVGADSAVLGWKSFAKIGVTYVTALQIEYKEENYTTWNQTSRLQPHVTSHMITELQSESIYRARLVVLTSINSAPRVPTRDLVFKTKSFDVADNFILDVENVQVGQTSVIIRWSSIAPSEIPSIASVEIIYNEVNNPAATLKVSSQPSSLQCIIPNLKQSTNYKAVINVLFHNGTRVLSGTIHFVTDSADKSSNLIIPLAVSGVVIITAIVIVLVTCCLWRKSRMRPVQDTAFENKIFNIQIHNDGRTLSART